MDITEILDGLAAICFGCVELYLTQGKCVHPYFKGWWPPGDARLREANDKIMNLIGGIFFIIIGLLGLLGGTGVLKHG